MTKATLRTNALGFLAAIPLAVGGGHAAQAQVPGGQTAGDTAVTFRVSTLGLGTELSKQVGRRFAGRLSFNDYSYSASSTYQHVAYNANLHLNSFSALGDFYPSARGAFHLTGGLVIDNNKLTGVGTPAGMSGTQTFTLNGHTYTVGQVGSLNGQATFARLAPYLGFGFGNPNAGGSPLRLLLDLGVVAQGKADLSLTATGAAADPSLAADVEAQRRATQSDLNKLQFFPVVSVGFAYHY